MPRQVRTLIAALGGAGLVLLLSIAQPGGRTASAASTLAFDAAFIVMLSLVPIAPRSHAFTALATLLSLGFWTKFLVHLAAAYPFIEPIGRFDGSTAGWNAALATVTVAIIGVIAARAAHLLWARATGRPPEAERPADSFRTPRFYVHRLHATWVATGLALAASYLWNGYAAVYATGVDPKVVLPLKANAALSWWYLMGAPLWLATLLGWEMNRRGRRTLGPDLLWIPVVEAAVNAGSLLSRATYLLRIVPYLLAATRSNSRGAVRLVGSRVALTALMIGGLVVSLSTAMAVRVLIYYRPAEQPRTAAHGSGEAGSAVPPAAVGGLRPPGLAAGPAGFAARPVFFAVREVGMLLIDRWTGLEGVLAVSAADRSPSLLRAAVLEDPRRGEGAIYQHIAAAPYAHRPGFTFLTLAGIVAVLAMSGSPVVVAVGMAVVTMSLIATEAFVRRFLQNEVTCAVVAIGGAFTVSQVTFPRLLGAFVVELWMTLGILVWLQGRATWDTGRDAGGGGRSAHARRQTSDAA